MRKSRPLSRNHLNGIWAMSDAQKKERGVEVLSDDEAEQAMKITTTDNVTVSVRRKPGGRWQGTNVGSIKEYDEEE